MNKRNFVILIAILIFLAACQPVPPAQGQQDNPDGTVGTVPAGDILDGEQTPDKDSGSPSGGELVWNRDPGALVISGTFCCGFTTPLTPLNYIPDFQIWGDGRMLWVENNDDDGSRRVLQGQLSESQLQSILADALDAGFFDWQERYADNTVADFADKCLTIALQNTTKQVCEYYKGAPPAFHELYDRLAAGAGLAGTDYVPESGFLTSYILADFTLGPISEKDVVWPAEKLFSLDEVEEKGMFVEGEALELAWRAVNQSPWNPVIRQGSGAYQVSLQIPGVSMQEPPGR